MAKKKRKDAVEEQSIVFDPKARYKYITGFRKRKNARRKKAYMEDLEAERNDSIDVRREIRDEVKQRWKAVKDAEKRIDKILALQDGKRRRLALQDEAPDPVEVDVDSEPEEPLQMITFEQEDDDPFGGCEVTTTIPSGELSILGGDQSSRLLALANGPSEDPDQGDEETTLMVAPPEDPEERARRRAANIAKAEVVRKKALAKKVVKLIELKQKQKKAKGKKKKKRGKNNKAGAKARRRRK